MTGRIRSGISFLQFNYIERRNGLYGSIPNTVLYSGSPVVTTTGNALTQFTHDAAYNYWVTSGGLSVPILNHTKDEFATTFSSYSLTAVFTVSLTNLEGCSTNPAVGVACNRHATGGFALVTFDGGATAWWGNVPSFFSGKGVARLMADLSDFIPARG